MSITNKLNQIKNAIYGKEVRGAIHDAIKECYDDASVNHDNANMEVKMARGTHNTLNDRLDNVDEIQAQTNAQLSNKASVQSLAIERARIDALTTLEQGSTTGDAELVDGRISQFGGKKYESIGNSIRGQISLLQNEILSVFDAYSEIASDWIDGFCVSSHSTDGLTNRISAHSNYKYSAKIDVAYGDKIIVLTYAETAVSVISHTYSDDTMRSKVAGRGNYDFYSYTVEQGVTSITVCASNKSEYPCYIYKVNAIELQKNKQSDLEYKKIFNSNDLLLNLEVEYGKYISDGVIKDSNAGWIISSPIKLKKGEMFKCYTKGYNSSITMIALCDETGNIISDLVKDNGGNRSVYSYKALCDCYVRVCSSTEAGKFINIYASINHDSFNENVDYEPIEKEIVSTGGYWISKGDSNIYTTGSNSWKMTEPFILKKGETVEVVTKGLGSLAVISKYIRVLDKNVCVVGDNGTNIDLYRYTANVDEEIRVCYHESNYNIRFYRLNIPITHTIFNNTHLNLDYYKALFTNAICIGDSLTEGYRSTTYTDKNKSYPAFLSRLSGWNVTNAGVSGITASGWYNREYSKYTFTDYDICFIFLGQNKTISDSVENKAYTDIIDGILTQNPKIKIFLIPSGTAESKESIKQIGVDKELAVLDLDENEWFKLSENRLYHIATDGTWYDVHYNTIGYLALAKVIFALMNQHIAQNESDYWDF